MKITEAIPLLMILSSTLCFNYQPFETDAGFYKAFRTAYQPYMTKNYYNHEEFSLGFNDEKQTVFADYHDYNKVIVKFIGRPQVQLNTQPPIMTKVVEAYMDFFANLKGSYETLESLVLDHNNESKIVSLSTAFNRIWPGIDFKTAVLEPILNYTSLELKNFLLNSHCFAFMHRLVRPDESYVTDFGYNRFLVRKINNGLHTIQKDKKVNFINLADKNLGERLGFYITVVNRLSEGHKDKFQDSKIIYCNYEGPKDNEAEYFYWVAFDGIETAVKVRQRCEHIYESLIPPDIKAIATTDKPDESQIQKLGDGQVAQDQGKKDLFKRRFAWYAAILIMSLESNYALSWKQKLSENFIFNYNRNAPNMPTLRQMFLANMNQYYKTTTSAKYLYHIYGNFMKLLFTVLAPGQDDDTDLSSLSSRLHKLQNAFKVVDEYHTFNGDKKRKDAMDKNSVFEFVLPEEPSKKEEIVEEVLEKQILEIKEIL